MDFSNNLKTKMEHLPSSSGAFLTGDHHIICARRNRPKLIPPPLVLPIDVTSLTEFAIIATSPRSPLMQKNLPIRKRALSCSSMEAVQSPIPTPGILSPPAFSSINNNIEDSETAASSPSPFPASSFNTYGIAGLQVTNTRNGNWTHPPVPVWHCFLKGTKICFNGEGCRWRLAEDLGFEEAMKRTTQYAPYGLKLVERRCKVADSFTRLSFSPTNDPEQSTNRKTKRDLIEVECSSDHPFYAKDKGWSSIHPQLTIERYGLFCHPLQINDVCLPSFNPDASFNSGIYESIRSFDFTPEDTSAVLALSNMAKHKQSANQMISGVGQSPPQSPNKKFSVVDSNNGKSKRPMNGFMLFAKQHRVEYTQIYPGKDNRAISVLLGDSWKRMSVEERNTYAHQAKILAEERKKIFPDCWKRRRSLSTS